MITRNTHITFNNSQRTGLRAAGLFRGGLLILMVLWFSLTCLSASAQTRDALPKDMAFVPAGPTIIGIDKGPSTSKIISKEGVTLYQRRMSMPWSKEAFHDEGPAHWVFLDGFFIDKYETSNKQYSQFMKSTGHPGPAYWDDPRLNKPNQPVVGVNWFDAKVFCEYAGKRLPTESEWERAARGPHGLRYPWGNTLDPAKANFGNNFDSTLPVNSLPEGSSPYGLHHMAGNVFEWVQDWYDPNFYQKTPHPPNTHGPLKPIWIGGTGTYVDRLTVGAKRVIRGGSWIAADSSITTTHRFWNHPSNNSYGVGLGFRCAQTAPESVSEFLRVATIEAMKYMGMEKWKESNEELEKALDLDPHNEELKQMQAIVKTKL